MLARLDASSKREPGLSLRATKAALASGRTRRMVIVHPGMLDAHPRRALSTRARGNAADLIHPRVVVGIGLAVPPVHPGGEEGSRRGAALGWPCPGAALRGHRA
jgi:hypothetical protein